MFEKKLILTLFSAKILFGDILEVKIFDATSFVTKYALVILEHDKKKVDIQ